MNYASYFHFLQCWETQIKSDLVSISNLFEACTYFCAHPPTYLCSHLSGIIALVFMFIHEISLLLSLFTSLSTHSVYKISILYLLFVNSPAQHSTQPSTFTHTCLESYKMWFVSLSRIDNTIPLFVHLKNTGPSRNCFYQISIVCSRNYVIEILSNWSGNFN